MSQSYQVLKEAIKPKGAKFIAESMGLSASIVFKWSQSPFNAGTAIDPLQRVIELHKITQDDSIIQWICQKTGGVFVRDVEVEELTAGNLFGGVQDILEEFSEMLSAITVSKVDGSIDKIETAVIRKEWQEMKAATERFVLSCERGDFLEKEKK